ncbi:hypothetical protein JKG47_10005 [Acidithiobacillus sp. MC6.1]|nr:hypothetical protein [Acidithiobacillus sp. MC6.1]
MSEKTEQNQSKMLIAEISQKFPVSSVPDFDLAMVETGVFVGEGPEPITLYVHLPQDGVEVLIEDGCQILERLGFWEMDDGGQVFMDRVIRLHGLKIAGRMLSVSCAKENVVQKLERMVHSIQNIAKQGSNRILETTSCGATKTIGHIW